MTKFDPKLIKITAKSGEYFVFSGLDGNFNPERKWSEVYPDVPFGTVSVEIVSMFESEVTG